MKEIPTSTYRLQFSHQFTFKRASELVDYFNSLGISHLYASPLLKARGNSLHGYDVVDYGHINPEIGSEEDFKMLIQKLQKNGMGLILDFVPNHMSATTENKWWVDLLENGIASQYADYFDIDWHPSKKVFDNKVFLPILESPFGNTLEEKLIQVVIENGQIQLKYRDNSLPTSIESWLILLTPLYNETKKLFPLDHPSNKDLNDIILGIEAFKQENNEKKQQINKHLRTLLAYFLTTHSVVRELFEKQLEVFNGIKGNPNSFNELEKFIEQQHYRLCFWKTANDEINFRRFFDIFEYASLKIENANVFKSVHEKVFEFLNNGWINGLRIDHIDGIGDPQKYLEDLHQFSTQKIPYLVVEKILTGNESLQKEWPVQGTVGYEFINQLNGLFIYQSNKQKIFDIYQDFVHPAESERELKYICKKIVLNSILSSELNLLSRKLNFIAENHRSSQDFTAQGLKNALTEVLASYPIYRTYIRPKNNVIHEEDSKCIIAAIEKARRFNGLIDSSLYNFIQNVLLLRYPEGSDNLKTANDNFVTHFQQLSGPVMAKGFEDTALYRFYPLSSLNEVGGDPAVFGISLDNFHKKNQERSTNTPYGSTSSTTHDTKRSEDVRARINVLSEMPQQWQEALNLWNKINQNLKTKIDDEVAPDCNEEYLIYQTLIGTWPLEEFSTEVATSYIERIKNYMEKAINEAKIHSNWIDSNKAYQDAVKCFIEKILTPNTENQFLNNFLSFVEPITEFGMLNSLSQLIIKLTSPGIPNIYQGNELWDFSLVDPDNRRPVDFEKCKRLIEELNHSQNSLNPYIQNPKDGKIKLFVTNKILKLRNEQPTLFLDGNYVPLIVEEEGSSNVIAFARYLPKGGQAVLVLTTRFHSQYMSDFRHYKDENHWKKISIQLPQTLTNRSYKNIFSQEMLKLSDTRAPLDNIFKTFPFAVLISV